MKITLWSTNCPKCNVIKKKLEQKCIKFDLVEDTDKVLEFGKLNNIMSAPLLEVENGVHKVYTFKDAVDFINSYKEGVIE